VPLNHQTIAVAPRRLKLTEAASRLGIAPRAVSRLVERGELKAVIVPGLRPTVLESSVEALIARMSEGEVPQAG
jgi:predicted site-specific integrase-resolvase